MSMSAGEDARAAARTDLHLDASVRLEPWMRWRSGTVAEPFHLPPWVTLWVPVVVAALAQVPPAVWSVVMHPELSPAVAGVRIGLAVLGPIALCFARRFPGPVVAVLAVAGSLDVFVGDGDGPPYVALGFGIIGAVVRGAQLWAWASVGVSWSATIVAAAVIGLEKWTPLRIALTTLGIVLLLGVGEAIRAQRQRVTMLRRQIEQLRASEAQAERVRIARELHDVLAHSLSQINVQASVGLHLMEKQPEKASEALASIKDTSKTALDEVRSVLGALRSGSGSDVPLVPEPDLARLPGLAASVTAQGIEVSLDDELSHDDVPAQMQSALYRIAQESLTNVQRHARDAQHASVRLWRDAAAYRIEVADDGHGSVGTSESGGRGVLGMRERAELLGGRLTAGPAPDGGFLVAGEIPRERVGAR